MAEEISDAYAPIHYDASLHAGIHTIRLVAVYNCADSRNSPQLYYPAKDTIIDQHLESGTYVDFFRMNDPGVYMTKKADEEFKGHILKKLEQYREFAGHGVKIVVEVHIVGHAHARRKQDFAKIETFGPEHIRIEDRVTNCGMAHAQAVVKSLQDFLIEVQPTFTVGGKKMPIRTVDNLREFMKITYKNQGVPQDWNGDLSTWVKGIENYATHPQDQMRIFDNSVKNDPRFKNIVLGRDLLTFAHVYNYDKKKVYRVDGKNSQPDYMIGPIYNEIRRIIRSDGLPADHEDQTKGQKDVILTLSDPLIPGARQLVVQQLFNLDSPAGKIFSIARKLDEGPFDIFSMLGMYYALSPRHLNEKSNGRLVVAAIGEEGAAVAYKKIHRDDNIVSLIVRNYVREEKLVALPLDVVDRRQHFPNQNRIRAPALQPKQLQRT